MGRRARTAMDMWRRPSARRSMTDVVVDDRADMIASSVDRWLDAHGAGSCPYSCRNQRCRPP